MRKIVLVLVMVLRTGDIFLGWVSNLSHRANSVHMCWCGPLLKII